MNSGLALIVGWCLATFALMAQAQQPPLLDQISNGINDRPEVKAAAEVAAWFQQNRYGVAYFDEIDFRVSGITNDKSQYAFRLRPTNPFYFAAGKNVGRILEAEAQLALKEAVQQALLQKLQLWLKIRNEVLLLQEARASLEWRQRWMENMQQYISEGSFDATELLDIELERIDLGVDLVNHTEDLHGQLAAFFEIADESRIEKQASELSSKPFPQLSLSKLLAALEENNGASFTEPLVLERRKLSVELTESKVALERRDWDIGFVQPEWDNSGGERFGLRVGVGIPIFNGNRMQTQNRQLDLISDKWEEVKTRGEWELKLKAGLDKVVRIADRLKAINDLDGRLDSYQQQIGAIEPDDARKSLLKWLKAKEKLRARVIKDQFLLLSAYLDYLQLRTVIAEPGLVSYFENIW